MSEYQPPQEPQPASAPLPQEAIDKAMWQPIPVLLGGMAAAATMWLGGSAVAVHESHKAAHATTQEEVDAAKARAEYIREETFGPASLVLATSVLTAAGMSVRNRRRLKAMGGGFSSRPLTSDERTYGASDDDPDALV